MESIGLTALLLVSFLDSNSFRVRQEAEFQLCKMDNLAYPQLTLCSKCTKSIEVSVRIRRILNRQNSVIINCICDGVPPYIDAIPNEGIGIVCNSRDRASLIYGYVDLVRLEGFRDRLEREKISCRSDGEHWANYRLAGRIWLEDLRESGVEDDEIVKIVKVLKDRSEYYRTHNAHWPE